MKFKNLVILMIVLVLTLSACAPEPMEEQELVEEEQTDEPAEAAEEVDSLPQACLDDAFGCAVISQGETIKIGMGAPLLGDYSMFGTDISQGVSLALQLDDGLEGWTYELVAEDTGGAPEAGAAVANKMVTDPTVVAIAGHIFSGSTEAAMPIYEKAGLPMMSPSATEPGLTQQGSKVFNRLILAKYLTVKHWLPYYLQNPLSSHNSDLEAVFNPRYDFAVLSSTHADMT